MRTTSTIAVALVAAFASAAAAVFTVSVDQTDSTSVHVVSNEPITFVTVDSASFAIVTYCGVGVEDDGMPIMLTSIGKLIIPDGWYQTRLTPGRRYVLTYTQETHRFVAGGQTHESTTRTVRHIDGYSIDYQLGRPGDCKQR